MIVASTELSVLSLSSSFSWLLCLRRLSCGRHYIFTLVCPSVHAHVPRQRHSLLVLIMMRCLLVMPGTPVMLLPEGSVPVNSKVVEIINIVKPQAVELIDYANNVRSPVFGFCCFCQTLVLDRNKPKIPAHRCLFSHIMRNYKTNSVEVLKGKNSGLSCR